MFIFWSEEDKGEVYIEIVVKYLGFFLYDGFEVTKLTQDALKVWDFYLGSSNLKIIQ